jgi:hypothetical protein
MAGVRHPIHLSGCTNTRNSVGSPASPSGHPLDQAIVYLHSHGLFRSHGSRAFSNASASKQPSSIPSLIRRPIAAGWGRQLVTETCDERRATEANHGPWDTTTVYADRRSAPRATTTVRRTAARTQLPRKPLSREGSTETARPSREHIFTLSVFPPNPTQSSPIKRTKEQRRRTLQSTSGQIKSGDGESTYHTPAGLP